MGTEYSLYKDDSFGQLLIDEMSNKLSLVLDMSDQRDIIDCIIFSANMKPEELVKIFLKGLTVCSYWMDSDELKEIINQYVYAEIY